MIDSKALINELRYRGFEGTILGNINEALKSGSSIYIGTDPSSIKEENRNPNFPEITSSLHVGHLAAFMAAKIFAKYGVKVIILAGGCTAKMGDPSGKTCDRALLSYDEISNNSKCIKNQLSKLFDFNSTDENAPIMVDNDDWMKNYSFVDFSREVGKYLTVNYLMAKDSIKQRFEREGSGISVLEFLYQLVQANDFLYLREKYNCKIQLAGLDQIGNATSGQELARKSKGIIDMCGYFIPLVTDSSGKKFGKSEGGKAVFLDRHLTTPYEFYQFWINQTDEMAEQLIKKFTLLPIDDIEAMIAKHRENPSKRYLQKMLAFEVTKLIHSEEDAKIAEVTTEILFGKPSKETLTSLNAETFEKVFNGVPTFEISKENFENGTKFIDACVECGAFKSKGELRKLVQSNGIKANYDKVDDTNYTLTIDNLIHGKFMTIQKGKKANMLVIAK